MTCPKQVTFHLMIISIRWPSSRPDDLANHIFKTRCPDRLNHLTMTKCLRLVNHFFIWWQYQLDQQLQIKCSTRGHQLIKTICQKHVNHPYHLTAISIRLPTPDQMFRYSESPYHDQMSKASESSFSADDDIN